MQSARVVAKGAAVLCYLLALAGAGAFGLRVVLLGIGMAPTTPELSAPWPWVIDVTLLLLFGVQHTGMARDAFKRRWTRTVPPSLERSVYAAVSGLVVGGLALTWQPLDGLDLWRGPPWLEALPLTGALGLALVNFRFDHAGLFGLRQAWAGDRPAESERLLIVGPYRFVRHPLMACLLVFLWVHPVMPPGLALLSGGLTLYIAVGLFFEERDLLRRFHPAYAAYRRRVPALLPWRRPVPPS